MSIYSEIKPEVRALAEKCVRSNYIDPQLYVQYDVKRGLRDLNGKGVLTGLTNISEIISSKNVDGKSVPCEGELYYRGYNVEELVARQVQEDHFGFERTAYLLLFGDLPTQEELETFCQLLSFYRTLPTSFVRDIIMKAPSSDMMNTLARSVLTLYSYDDGRGRYLHSQRAAPVHAAHRPVPPVARCTATRPTATTMTGRACSSTQPGSRAVHGGEHPADPAAAGLLLHGAGGPGAGHLP